MAPPRVKGIEQAGAAGPIDAGALNDPFRDVRLPAKPESTTSRRSPLAVISDPLELGSATASTLAKLPDLSYSNFVEHFPAGQEYKAGRAAADARDAQFKQVTDAAANGDATSQRFLTNAIVTRDAAGMAGETLTMGNRALTTGWWIAGTKQDGNEGSYLSSASLFATRAAMALSDAAADPKTSPESKKELPELLAHAIKAQNVSPENRLLLQKGLQALATPGPDGKSLISAKQESEILIAAVQADLAAKPAMDEFQRTAMTRLMQLQPPGMYDQIQTCLKDVQANSQPLGRAAATEHLAAHLSPTLDAGELLTDGWGLQRPSDRQVPASTTTDEPRGILPGFTPGEPGVDDPPAKGDKPPALVPTTSRPPEPPEPALLQPPATPKGLDADLAEPPEPARTRGLEADKGPEADKGLEADKPAVLLDNVKRDALGKVTEIHFPNGSSALFDRKDGTLNSVTITEPPAAPHTFVRDGEKWYSTTSGKRVALNGKMEIIDADGTFSGPVGDGTKRLSWHPDGTTDTEQKLATGGTVKADGDGKPTLVTRKDGSTVSDTSGTGTPGFVETANGKSTEWKLTAGTDVWTSNDTPPQQRRNMKIEDNGNLTFTGSDNQKHIIRTNGAELVEGEGKSTFKFDEQGRIAAISYPDKNNIFSFKYKPGTEQIDEVTTHYVKTGKEKSDKPNRVWGEPMISPEGVYSQVAYQMLGGQLFKGLQTFNNNGDFIYNTLRTDGTVHITDAYNRKVYGKRDANQNDFLTEQPNQAGTTTGDALAQAQQARNEQIQQQLRDRDNQEYAQRAELAEAQRQQQALRQTQQPTEYATNSQPVNQFRQQCPSGGCSQGYQNNGFFNQGGRRFRRRPF